MTRPVGIEVILHRLHPLNKFILLTYLHDRMSVITVLSVTNQWSDCLMGQWHLAYQSTL